MTLAQTQTVAQPKDINEELRHLVTVFGAWSQLSTATGVASESLQTCFTGHRFGLCQLPLLFQYFRKVLEHDRNLRMFRVPDVPIQGE
jgi:hypothetical protein